jgi:radical SAM modification target selenobiotic family peptide
MDVRQLKKILASLGLAGLMATAGLALPGCAKQQPAEQTS